jgi:Arc/MetJ family transcription regulator
MRTTMNIDDDLMKRAMRYAGVKERTAIVRMALEQFVAIEAEKRLATMKGTLPHLKAPPRRRPPDFRNPE